MDGRKGDAGKTSENYLDEKIEELLLNSDIIRHRGKIVATINNAKRFIEIQQEFHSFSKYMWGFINNETRVSNIKTSQDYPATTIESDLFCKDLKKRGFKFVGSTICYAYMQANGMVNDHRINCYRRNEIIDQFNQAKP